MMAHERFQAGLPPEDMAIQDAYQERAMPQAAAAPTRPPTVPLPTIAAPTAEINSYDGNSNNNSIKVEVTATAAATAEEKSASLTTTFTPAPNAETERSPADFPSPANVAQAFGVYGMGAAGTGFESGAAARAGAATEVKMVPGVETRPTRYSAASLVYGAPVRSLTGGGGGRTQGDQCAFAATGVTAASAIVTGAARAKATATSNTSLLRSFAREPRSFGSDYHNDNGTGRFDSRASAGTGVAAFTTGGDAAAGAVSATASLLPIGQSIASARAGTRTAFSSAYTADCSQQAWLPSAAGQRALRVGAASKGDPAVAVGDGSVAVAMSVGRREDADGDLTTALSRAPGAPPALGTPGLRVNAAGNGQEVYASARARTRLEGRYAKAEELGLGGADVDAPDVPVALQMVGVARGCDGGGSSGGGGDISVGEGSGVTGFLRMTRKTSLSAGSEVLGVGHGVGGRVEERGKQEEEEMMTRRKKRGIEEAV